MWGHIFEIFYSFVEITSCTAVLLIPYFLRESPLLFFNKNIRQPRILRGVGKEADLDKVLAPTTNFQVKWEGVTIPYTDDFVKAFAMLLSTDPMFSIYPVLKNCKPVYTWSRNCSLRLQAVLDGVKVPHKILFWSLGWRNCYCKLDMVCGQSST